MSPRHRAGVCSLPHCQKGGEASIDVVLRKGAQDSSTDGPAQSGRSATSPVNHRLASGSLRRTSTKARSGSAQSLLSRVSHGRDLGPAGPVHHDLRIEEPDHHAVRGFLAHDHIASQQQADVGHGLRGKVVLVSFWTYSCINCLHSLPHVLAWAEKYKRQRLVVIGVHAPEFAAEKNLANVRKATRELRIDYPVAVDNDFVIWRAFKNQYWPAHYFVDAQGRVRHHHYGEGEYDGSERVIQQLLAEADRAKASQGWVKVVDAGGRPAASIAGKLPDRPNRPSPEPTVGRARAG
jgi:thiol-disulfide isomerase/thioredoxin